MSLSKQFFKSKSGREKRLTPMSASLYHKHHEIKARVVSNIERVWYNGQALTVNLNRDRLPIVRKSDLVL